MTTKTTKTEVKHPFGELLAQYRQHKPGLTQTRLAELAGYDQAILVRMCQGKKDLTGPSGRERVVRLIETLADQGALTTLDEANALLLAADMPPLFERQVTEARLIEHLSRLQPGHRVRRTNLPAPLTSFIGRANEIAEVRRLLHTTRLLTLTGAGGCGKTRLAQRIAADVLIGYSEGVWYAELAALADPALIADAVVRALGLAASDMPAQMRVQDFLRERHVLLVLDNCEHLIDAVVEFALAVLRACPRVTILATSREALNVEGETAWRVPPMQPDEAGRLFVDRAAAARSDVALSVQDTTVSHICQRLDGMPLAIELAEARLNALSLNDIAARLDDRFNLLAGGRRGALPRHQTLRALIDWSHDQLDAREKIVFRRLGVFVGEWELSQAEQVASDEWELEEGEKAQGIPASQASPDVIKPSDVLPLLTSLVGKSLVTLDEQEGMTCYRCLETIREYALEKLREYDELACTQRRHAQAYLELAEQRWEQAWKDQKSWMRDTRASYSNMTAALAWCFGSHGNPVIGCRLVSMMFQVWDTMGTYMRDGRRWYRLAYEALTDDVPARSRGWLYLRYPRYTDDVPRAQQLMYKQKAFDLLRTTDDSFGHVLAKTHLGLAVHFDDRSRGRGLALVEDSVAQARATQDDFVIAIALIGLAIILNDLGEFERAERTSLEVVERGCRTSEHNIQATGLMKLAITFMQQLQFARAIECLSEAVEHTRTVDDPVTTSISLSMIAENARYLGDLHKAVRFGRESLQTMRESLGAPFREMQPVTILCKSLADVGEHEAAVLLINQHLSSVSQHIGPVPGKYSRVLDATACLACHAENHKRVASLFGAADADLLILNRKRGFNYMWEYAPVIAKSRAALGDDAYDAAYAEGRAMTVAQAIDYALSTNGNE